MADTLQGSFSLPGLVELPILKQIGVIVAFAATTALMLAIVLWADRPDYGMLFDHVPNEDRTIIMDVLNQNQVPFKVDDRTGAILVPADKVNKTKLLLAAQGLPKSKPKGFDMLDKEQKFGTSRFMERTRYQRALEGELAITISSISNIKSAKIHLALPKRSVFVRSQLKPTASVVVNLYPGRSLNKGQVASIIHLVASSIPLLEAEYVTVVNQKGKLLNAKEDDEGLGLSTKQLEYGGLVERSYIKRIDDILFPILGENGFSTSVKATMDFTQSESTRESFNPEMPSLRSEQIMEEISNNKGAQGVPGALTNTPPPGGEIETEEEKNNTATGSTPLPKSSSKRSVKNFELDREVSHTKKSVGILRKLSISVNINDKVAIVNNQSTRQSRTPEEMKRIEKLIMGAVGYDAARGDNIEVSNLSFKEAELAIEIPEPSFIDKMLENPSAIGWIKKGTGVLIALILAFGILGPAMKRLMATPAGIAAPREALPSSVPNIEEPMELQLPQQEKMARLKGPSVYEESLNMARKMVEDDPKRVAQLMKTWVAIDG